MEGGDNCVPEDPSCSSDDGQFAVALRQMMKKEIELTVIRTAHQVIVPMMEDLVRKVVKEEIQSAQEMFSTRNHANEQTNPRERYLTIKFLDEISGPVLTGKAIKGKSGAHVRVALVDKSTGQVVNSGPESSAKVEILVLDASGDDGDNDHHSLRVEDFNRRTIREGDKKKPHFTRSKYIYLDKGVGILCNAKLGHDSSWMKSCKCLLGARLVGSFGGINVQEATTKSFMVLDSRSKLYDNHYPPCLSDHVWRLENIGKDGPRCERLNENNITTVRDFLFLHTIDPQRLEKIVSAGARWKATVDHALTCSGVDDGKMYLYCPSSSESRMGVTFDVVGGLKGLIHGSHYVPVNNLSGDEKECAHKLLLAAFENKEDITPFHEENSLMRRFPLRPSDTNVATTSSNVSDLSIPENINGHDARELDLSSESWVSQLYDETYHDLLWEYLGDDDDENLVSLYHPEHLSDYLGGGPNSHAQATAANRSNLIKVAAVICVVRSSQRFMAGFRPGKRPKIF